MFSSGIDPVLTPPPPLTVVASGNVGITGGTGAAVGIGSLVVATTTVGGAGATPEVFLLTLPLLPVVLEVVVPLVFGGGVAESASSRSL